MEKSWNCIIRSLWEPWVYVINNIMGEVLMKYEDIREQCEQYFKWLTNDENTEIVIVILFICP